MHQLAQLNRTAEKPRCRHQERENDRRLTKKAGEPDQVFLFFDQLQVVGQHTGKASVQVFAFHLLAFVQCNRFAVFTHPNHVVTKVRLKALLLKIQFDLRATNEVRDQTAKGAVQQGHPHHEARNVVAATRQSK